MSQQKSTKDSRRSIHLRLGCVNAWRRYCAIRSETRHCISFVSSGPFMTCRVSHKRSKLPAQQPTLNHEKEANSSHPATSTLQTHNSDQTAKNNLRDRVLPLSAPDNAITSRIKTTRPVITPQPPVTVLSAMASPT